MDVIRIVNEFECSILNEAKMSQSGIKVSPGLKMACITQIDEAGTKNNVICSYKKDQCQWTSKECIYSNCYQ